MKHLAFGAGVLSLVAAVTLAAFVATTGEVTLTGFRFRGDILRGPGAYALALGGLFGGAVAFFASCMSMWPQRPAFFGHLRTLSLVVAGGARDWCEELLLLYTTDLLFEIVPKKWFPNADQMYEFRRLAKRET